MVNTYPSQIGEKNLYLRPQPPSHPQPQLLTLEAVLGGDRIVPPYSLVLGLCEDQLPLVLDLSDPAPGSILIAGDSGFANTTLLHSLITSVFLANTAYEVNAHLISPEADSLKNFHRQPGFCISYQPDRPECVVILEEMTTLVQTRKRSGKRQPYHVLFIDSLDLLWDSLSPQGKLWLNWLVAYGPACGLWVIATLETGYLKPILFRTLNSFPARILGNIQLPGDASFLSGFSRPDLEDLDPELEFTAYLNGQAYRLWLLPTIQDC